jgi:hypothetical protein
MANDHAYTQQEAIRLAKRFNAIAAVERSFSKFSKKMHTVRPGLDLLLYTNGAFSSPRAAQHLPREWFLRDRDGDLIRSTAFGNYLMNPASPGWQAHVARVCRFGLRRSGYDGCLVDMVNFAVFTPGYLSSQPCLPGSQRLLTRGDWQRDLLELEDTLRRADLPVTLNTVVNGYSYWKAPVTSRRVSLASRADQFEGYLRHQPLAPASDFPTYDEWLEDEVAVSDLEDHGHRVLLTTKVWAGGTPSQLQQWNRFSAASYLLVATGKAFFDFTDARTKEGATAQDPYLRKDLGLPLGVATHQARIWSRRFEGGTVVVNPTTSPITTQVAGQESPITVGAEDAVILP